MSDKTIRVLIVDDHPMVRKGLAMFVNGSDGLQLVGEVGTAKGALEKYENEHPDVVLMDMVLHETSGANVIRQIHQRNPNAAIIALTHPLVMKRSSRMHYRRVPADDSKIISLLMTPVYHVTMSNYVLWTVVMKLTR